MCELVHTGRFLFFWTILFPPPPFWGIWHGCEIRELLCPFWESHGCSEWPVRLNPIGEVPRLEAQTVERKLVAIFADCRGLQPPDAARRGQYSSHAYRVPDHRMSSLVASSLAQQHYWIVWA
jgi:hypothetical protein